MYNMHLHYYLTVFKVLTVLSFNYFLIFEYYSTQYNKIYCIYKKKHKIHHLFLNEYKRYKNEKSTIPKC